MAIFPDYPAPAGNKLEVVGQIAGPSAYTGITPAAPPTTGGVVLNASQIGLQAIEHIEFSLSNNGQYGIRVCYQKTADLPVSSVRLMIFTAATGAEISTTDLSSYRFRYRAVGI